MDPASPRTDHGKAASTNPFTLAVVGTASLVVCAAGGWALRGLRSDSPAAPQVPPAAITSSPQPHARGRLVFQVHCARCHGPNGQGDGTDAASLRPPPRNLTMASWRTAATVESVRQTVHNGIPGTMMPGLGAAFSPRELDAVVDYVLSIAPEEAKSTLSPLMRAAGFTPPPRTALAPSFEIRDMQQKAVNLQPLRGQVVVVVFWGTSCVPCVKELAELGQLAERYRGKDFRLLPICADETDPAVTRSVAAERAPTLPVYLDPSGSAKLAYDVQSLPSAALIAPDGRLLGRSQGSLRWLAPEMEALLDALLPVRQSQPNSPPAT